MTIRRKDPAWQAAEKRDWVAYYDRVAGNPPRDTLLGAIANFETQGRADEVDHRNNPRLAIDLGCGDGRDTAELLRRGFRVIAIDDHPDGIRRLRERTDADINGAIAETRLEIRQEGFNDSPWPTCELLNASFSLPFCEPDRFTQLWSKITRSIKPNGRFAGQLFGDRDAWSTIDDRTHHTRDQAIALFDGFLLEQFNEEERDGEDAHNNHKHWHVFHIVARKHE